jgi:hypothetical protein
MRSLLVAVAMALLLPFGASTQGVAPGASEAAIKDFFNGQQMLVTYREGGALYGTYFTLQVHFCRSGRYLTFGESRRQTVLDNEQVNRFTDEGTWEITPLLGRLVLKYVSVSGQPNAVVVNVAPNGRVSLGDGITVIRQGLAQCPR